MLESGEMIPIDIERALLIAFPVLQGRTMPC